MNKFKHRDPDWWKDTVNIDQELEISRRKAKRREQIDNLQMLVLCTLTAVTFAIITMLGWFIGKALIGQ